MGATTKKKTRKPRRIRIMDKDDGHRQDFLCAKLQDEKAVLCLYNFWIGKADVKRLAKWFAQAEKWLEEK